MSAPMIAWRGTTPAMRAQVAAASVAAAGRVRIHVREEDGGLKTFTRPAGTAGGFERLLNPGAKILDVERLDP